MIPFLTSSLSFKTFTQTPVLSHLPIKAPECYLLNFLNIYLLDFLAFSFTLYRIKLAQHHIAYFYSCCLVKFCEQIILYYCLTEVG